MRISKSHSRKMSTRRAHRPDQRVYRTLRLRRIGGSRAVIGRWIALAIGVVGLVLILVWALR